MILGRQVLARIVAGEQTLVFRRWRRPTVRAGGTLRTSAGVLAIDAVDVIGDDEVTDEDARAVGFDGRDALLARLTKDAPLHRIAVRYAGPDPRVALRETSSLTGAERAELDDALARIDGASRRGPWTRDVLELIGRRPGVLAADLAAEAGRERLAFKRDVRRLKELGLTESLTEGYRLSPRGRAYLARP